MVTSSTILSWKFRKKFAGTPVVASANVFGNALHVMVVAFAAVAVTLQTNHSYDALFFGLYVSSRTIICESVPITGRFVIERFPENVQRATSKNLNAPAASVPAHSI